MQENVTKVTSKVQTIDGITTCSGSTRQVELNNSIKEDAWASFFNKKN
jgi:hypothetical protein